MDIQINRAKRFLNNISTEVYTQTKLTQVKDKKRILKPTGGKHFVTDKGTLIKQTANFSAEICQVRGSGMVYSECRKKNTANKKYLTKLFFKNEGELKTYPRKQKLRKFMITRCDLQEMAKEVLQVETK